jgi:serine/threonine-protein kinase
MAVKPVDRQTFLDNLHKTGLIPPAELRAALRRLPSTERGRILARGLVEMGLLTRFQAERILVGRTEGFFLGQYRILEEIGRGGMGRVYKAEHQTMHRIVALKVLSSELTKTDRARHLFQREVRAAARLVDPNIVTAYDANEIGDRLYLVMEFVDGPNLQELVRKQGPLPVSQACDFIRQAALGLQHAHELGMVHRDIKPANLLVQRAPSRNPDAPPIYTVKILDFGLARLMEPEPIRPGVVVPQDPSGQHTVMGTPDFLAPEQARGGAEVDPRADLYSLGCTFYFLLTGRVPYPGGTALEKLVRHGTEEPQPLERRRPDVTLAVALIVRKMMAKEPDARYDSAEQVAEALAPLAKAQTAEPWLELAPQPEPELSDTPVPADDRPPTGPGAATDGPDLGGPSESNDEHTSLSTLPGDHGEPTVHSSSLLELPRRETPPWVWPVVLVALTLVIGFVLGLIALGPIF